MGELLYFTLKRNKSFQPIQVNKTISSKKLFELI